MVSDYTVWEYEPGAMWGSVKKRSLSDRVLIIRKSCPHVCILAGLKYHICCKCRGARASACFVCRTAV